MQMASYLHDTGLLKGSGSYSKGRLRKILRERAERVSLQSVERSWARLTLI